MADVREAVARLLWNEYHDDPSPCGGQCQDSEDTPFNTCYAMRALGYGEHWDGEVFAAKYRAERESGNVPTERFIARVVHVRAGGECSIRLFDNLGEELGEVE